MDNKDILVEKDGYVAIITLNRPDKLNALTLSMQDELLDILQEADADPEVRVIILTGAGRAFCAGIDMSSGETAADDTVPQDLLEEKASTVKLLFSLKKPVIVAYNGSAVGVGVTMTLPFDIRIAAESAKLSLAFVRRGLLPELACPWLLPKIIGISRAAEFMYTGRSLTAAEALDFGLVSRVVPDEELMPTALEMAREIAEKCSPVSVSLTKKMLYDFLAEDDVEKAEKTNHRYLNWIMTQPDMVEGIMSFMQKRKPEWTGKVPGDMPDLD
ncbi:MAG: enoyl-CoA hydratase-related protein [Actinomycetota bacterium]|nr:enoyl-CoA hydratase-related protein [Actinomycetota bacterium]